MVRGRITMSTRKKKKQRTTAEDRRMGERFHKLRLRLRPDLVTAEAFGEALRPPVTGQTARNWERGIYPIPVRDQRAICKLLPCDIEDLFAAPDAPLRREMTPPAPKTLEEQINDARQQLNGVIKRAISQYPLPEGWPLLRDFWVQSDADDEIDAMNESIVNSIANHIERSGDRELAKSIRELFDSIQFDEGLNRHIESYDGSS
jgi:hypothetical protein